MYNVSTFRRIAPRKTTALKSALYSGSHSGLRFDQQFTGSTRGGDMARARKAVDSSLHTQATAVAAEIGARHKKARVEVLKMSVAEYSAEMQVASASVYAWENGTRSIPTEILRALELSYNISTSWIYNGTEPMLLRRATEHEATAGQSDMAHKRKQESKNTAAPSIQSMLEDSASATLEQLQAINDYLQRAGKAISTLSREVFSLDNSGPRLTRFPLMDSSVSAGSPVSTSDDTVSVDIVEFLVNNPEHTFFVNVVGDSMKDIGIYDSDTLIIDRSIVPKSGEIIVARVFNELTVKRFVRNGKRVILAAENKAHKNIEVTEDMDFSIIGVVTTSIKKFRR